MSKEQSEAEKPDGWVAWHKGEFDMRLIPAKDDDGAPINQQDAIDIITRSWIKGKGLLSEGWRIRPVKLVFLDEVEK